MLEYVFSLDFIYSVLIISVPLIFASLAASLVQKADMINLGIEGMMLLSALMGVIFADISKNVWLAFIMTSIFGAFMGIVLCLLIIKLKADAVVSGIALNLFASGLVGLLLFFYSGDRGVAASIDSYHIDNMYFVVLSVTVTIIFYIMLYKTNFAYKVDAISKNELAARHANIKVDKVKLVLYACSGMLASIAGFYMSCSYMSKFSEGIIAGKGYIVLASSAMANNNPLASFMTACLFGLTKHLSDYFQLYEVSSNLIALIPYMISMFLIIIYGYKNKRA